MNFTDCTWELDNIGKKTLEIEYDQCDIFDRQDLCNAILDYDYIIAKVPAGNMNLTEGLQKIGFKYIESQFKISKKLKDFDYNDKLVKYYSNKVYIEVAKNEIDLNRILDSITINMFTSDRIYLDPQLGPELGLKRYKNWIKTEFYENSILYELILKDGKRIGFTLFKVEDEIVHVLLGGVYEKYQHVGFGMLVAMSVFLFRCQSGFDFKKEETAISSNNMSMLQFYNYLNFKVDNLLYVFVRHK